MAINIKKRIELTGGRSSGFDYMRLALSVTVVLLHTVSISYGENADAVFWYGPLKPVYRLVLPMFFALSGYLVAASLERAKTIGVFLGLRVLRIYPALATEVLLSALILGPLLTAVPLLDYFKGSEFHLYLWNVTGDIHYQLPGVFKQNPVGPVVNAQLWTVPYELLCYITLAIFSVAGILRFRAISICAVIFATIGFVAVRFLKYHGHFPETDAAFSGFLLIVAFLSGLTFYLYRDIVPWSGKLAVVCGLVSVLLVAVIPNGEYAAPLPIAYLTVYLGLTNFPRIGLLNHADLSYGIYLYGYTIQQAVADLFPWSRHWYLNGLISLPLVFLVAGGSWHFIERPALSLKSRLYGLETWYLARRSRGFVRPEVNAAPPNLTFGDLEP